MFTDIALFGTHEYQRLNSAGMGRNAVLSPLDGIPPPQIGNRLQNDLYCVGWGVKLYSIQSSNWHSCTAKMILTRYIAKLSLLLEFSTLKIQDYQIFMFRKNKISEPLKNCQHKIRVGSTGGPLHQGQFIFVTGAPGS